VKAQTVPLQVTVAATENALHIFDLPDGGAAHGAHWDQLPKTTVSADPSETLREVLRRAAADLEISVAPEVKKIHAKLRAERGEAPREDKVVDHIAFAEFRRPDDDEPADERGTLPRLARLKGCGAVVVRDERGHAVWRRPPFEATMAELIDAAEAGLLDGDPLAPYLVLVIPQGGFGTLGEWHEFAAQLRLLWELSGALAQVAGAWGFIELLRKVARRRSGEAAHTVEQNAVAWSERGARPSDLVELLEQRPRSGESIAALLGCSLGEAEAVLWGLGCSQDGDLWVYRGDQAADFIADDLQLESMLRNYRGAENLRGEFERRLTQLGREGRAASAAAEKQQMNAEFRKRSAEEEDDVD
jgi:hypothetical protein